MEKRKAIFYLLLLVLMLCAQSCRTLPVQETFPFLEPETIASLEEGRTSLTIRSNIPDAAVYLNGNYEGLVTLKINALMRGTYHLRMARDGFMPDDFTIEVISGCAQEYYIELKEQALSVGEAEQAF